MTDRVQTPERAEPDDRQLIAAVQAGDRRALAALLERHEPRIYRFAMKMCGHPEDAKEVLQDTLFAAARTARDFRGASSVPTWLWTIARSFCIKRRRKSKFAPEHEESLDTGADSPSVSVVDPSRDPEEALAGRQVERALDDAIMALDPKSREVLLLRDVEGLTAPEVAQVLGISVLAVKSRLHRARVAVRERVAPLLGFDDSKPAAPGTCPDVVTLLSQHLEDEISADTCAAMEKHLESCDRCQDACESLRRVLRMCRTSAAPVIPSALQESVKVALKTLIDS